MLFVCQLDLVLCLEEGKKEKKKSSNVVVIIVVVVDFFFFAAEEEKEKNGRKSTSIFFFYLNRLKICIRFFVLMIKLFLTVVDLINKENRYIYRIIFLLSHRYYF
jgi:hypothetical protein